MSNVHEPNEKISSTEKIDSDRSIPLEERIQATIRHPQYLKDWAEFNKNLMDYISTFPEDQAQPRPEDLFPTGLEDDPVAKKWNLPSSPPPLVVPRKGFSHNNNGNKHCSCDLLYDQSPRYLVIRVHLEALVQDIQKHVMDLVNFHREECGINRATRPTTEVDMWEVYDLMMRDYRNDKNNIMEIARRMWPDEKLGNPTYDPNAKKKWERISRAIKKTTQLVKRVDEEAAKNNIPLEPHPKLF